MPPRQYPTTLLDSAQAATVTATLVPQNAALDGPVLQGQLIATVPAVRKVTVREALQTILDHQALVKNIATVNPSAEPAFNRQLRDPQASFKFYIEQMKDPKNFRPARKLPEGANRKIRFNFMNRDIVTIKLR